jgi:hypothetical protein
MRLLLASLSASEKSGLHHRIKTNQKKVEFSLTCEHSFFMCVCVCLLPSLPFFALLRPPPPSLEPPPSSLMFPSETDLFSYFFLLFSFFFFSFSSIFGLIHHKKKFLFLCAVAIAGISLMMGEISKHGLSAPTYSYFLYTQNTS